MKITDLRATTVTVPLEAPLRHSNGAHWGRFVRTVVEVETDEGLVGLGEMGGGGESAETAIKGLKQYLVGHDPLQLEQLRWKIMNPVASLYNNPEVWPKFGYEGSSAEHGGYINRGFSDIDWLS